MEGLFSKRFSKALNDKVIPYPSFSRPLRKRLAMACRDFNEEYGGWDRGDTEDEAVDALKRAYGRDTLRVQDDTGPSNGDRDATGFDDFVVYAYPQHVLDALEAFGRLLSDNQHNLQVKLNTILEEERSPWRMSNGHMYLVDSRFLDALKELTEEEMKRENFLGAHEEFTDARSHLQAGEADDAIQKANRAFESALKSLLNQREGTADDLLKKLREETDLLDGVPDDAQKVIVSKVLQGLPVLRHKIAGHGQGAVPIEVPRPYGDLAINLAATYIKFLLDLKKDLAPAKKEDAQGDVDEDVPF